MSFKDHNFGVTYTASDNEDALKDFYIPALSLSTKYTRSVGYFSSKMLSIAAEGISGLLQNNGSMNLIIGDPLDEEEYEAIKTGEDHKQRKILEHNKVLEVMLESPLNELDAYRFDLLTSLIAADRLKISFAFKKGRGMVHEKMGLLEDSEGNELVFQGSMNDSENALTGDFNWESTSVFESWDEANYERHFLKIKKHLEKWTSSDVGEEIILFPLPSESYEIFLEKRPMRSKEDLLNMDELQLSNDLYQKNLDSKELWPKIPKYLNGHPYKLGGHQEKALDSWFKTQSEYGQGNFRGMFEHCTGSGKTISAIHGITTLADKTKNDKGGFFVVIAVPYQILADQWVSELQNFNIKATRCYISERLWKNDLRTKVSDFIQAPLENFQAVVVVNATLRSNDFFQEQLSRISEKVKDRFIFIGDECHHHTSINISRRLPDASLRLGLSATPYEVNEEKNQILRDYYGSIVDKYSIKQALEDEVLSKYDYHVHPIYLSEDEEERFNVLTRQIAALFDDSGSITDQHSFDIYSGQRARLLGSAEAKFEHFNSFLDTQSIPKKHSLFFCGDGSTEDDDNEFEEEMVRDLERISEILNQNGWIYSHFTYREGRVARTKIMQDFKTGDTQALVSIRVLDEGFDVPQCRTAFLIASSRNKRQYIQRRGRVLRKFHEKKASIHDYLILTNGYEESLFHSEALRICEFARYSENLNQIVDDTQDFFNRYGLTFDQILDEIEQNEAIN